MYENIYLIELNYHKERKSFDLNLMKDIKEKRDYVENYFINIFKENQAEEII